MSNFALVSFFIESVSSSAKSAVGWFPSKKTAMTQKRFQSEKMRKIEMEVSKL